MRERTPSQTPSIKSDLEGPLYLARSTYRRLVEPAQLDPELLARTEDRYAGIREAALAARPPAADPGAQSPPARPGGDRPRHRPRVDRRRERRRRGDGGESPIPAGNLTTNPSFESDTAGWDVSTATIATEPAADAPDGEHVVRARALTPGGDFAIDDSPDTIQSSIAGRRYTAAAWVKATESTNGELVCIGLRERAGSDDEPVSDPTGGRRAALSVGVNSRPAGY